MNDYLPPELLSSIFEQVVPRLKAGHATADLPRLSSSIHNSRHTLRSTCKFWQEVVDSDPRLWSTFIIKETSEGYTKSSYASFARNLARAKNCLLDICIVGKADGDPSILQSKCNTMLVMLGAQRECWRSMHLHNLHESNRWSTIVPHSLPRLEKIFLHNVAFVQGETTLERSAPRLKVLRVESTLSRIHYTWACSRFKDCTLLEHCMFTQPTRQSEWNDLLKLLRTVAARITKLEIRGRPSVTGEIPPPSGIQHIVELPMLKELVLDGCTDVGLTWLLGHLSAPQLDTIEIGRLSPSISGQTSQPFTLYPSLRQARFPEAISLFSVRRFLSKINEPNRIGIDLDARLGGLTRSAGRHAFEQLRADKRWLKTNMRELTWVPDGSTSSRYGKERVFWSWEEANGFVAI